MNKMLFAAAVLALGFASAAHAQRNGMVEPGKSMSNDSKSSTQIQGNTKIDAKGKNVTTTAKDGGTASTSVGSIGGNAGSSTQIQGNTTINASATDVTTSASGKGSSAATNVGTIGK